MNKCVGSFTATFTNQVVVGSFPVTSLSFVTADLICSMSFKRLSEGNIKLSSGTRPGASLDYKKRSTCERPTETSGML